MTINSCIIHHKHLGLGGAEKSIIRMIEYFRNENISVTLVLEYKGGILEKRLKDTIIIKYLRFFEYKSHDSFMIGFIKRIINRFYRVIMTSTFRFQAYDLAIVGFQNMNPSFIANRVVSDTKVHWIRSQISRRDSFRQIAVMIEKYQNHGFNYVCVSRAVYHDFVEVFPNFKERTKVIYNFLDPAQIINDANRGGPFRDTKKHIIVSVCRIEDKSKGVFRMLEVCCKLREERDDFVWYVLGDGPDMGELKQRVLKLKLGNTFLLVGKTENPYPYILSADFVAVLSYYEGLSGLINEAKILGRAVICTDFAGAREQIVDGENGLIIDNDASSIYEGIKMMLQGKFECIRNNYLPKAILDNHVKFNEIIGLLHDKEVLSKEFQDD